MTSKKRLLPKGSNKAVILFLRYDRNDITVPNCSNTGPVKMSK